MGYLTVVASGQHLTVDIQTPGGHPEPVFSDAALSTPITLPLAITADTDFYLGRGSGLVTVTVTTAAGLSLPTQTVNVQAPDHVVLTPLPTEAQQAQTDATAASSALSAKKFAFVTANTATPPTVTAGTSLYVDPTGATIQTAFEYSGNDFAAPLDITVLAGTPPYLVYPDDDAIYDIAGQIVMTCDPVDNGKMVSAIFNGTENSPFFYAPVVNGIWHVSYTTYDFAHLGDITPGFFIGIDAHPLSVNAAIVSCFWAVTKR